MLGIGLGLAYHGIWTASGSGFDLLMESGSYLLLENNNKIELEAGP